MFEKPFSHYGRIRRTEYGLSLIIYTVLATIINYLITESRGDAGIVGLVYIPMIWFLLAQGAKRCHDLGNSGWWQLIPLYGFWLLFQDGEFGENAYGDNPKNGGNTNYIYNEVSGNHQKDNDDDNQNVSEEVFLKSDSPAFKNVKQSDFFISHFGNFGKENGFKQFIFSSNHTNFNDVKSFDLDEDSIKIFPKTKMYSIRKESIKEQNIISYSIYTSVENNMLFCGSSILFINKIAEEYIILTNLNELHNKFFKNNIQNTNIEISHVNDLKIIKPKYFDNIHLYLKDIDNINNKEFTNQSLIVYCKTNPDNIQKMFEQSLPLLNFYDTIYFTESYQIAEYVHKKNIFKVIDAKQFEETIIQLNN